MTYPFFMMNYYNRIAAAAAAKSPGPDRPQLPALVVLSDRVKIDALVTQAGAAFKTGWDELTAKVIKNGYGAAAKEFSWSQGGRDYIAAVALVHPYRGIYSEVTPLTRHICIHGESGKNEGIFKATMFKALGAMVNRDVHAADKAIRLLGSVDGFSVKLDGI